MYSLGCTNVHSQLIHDSWTRPAHHPKLHPISTAIFAQLTADRSLYFTMGCHFSASELPHCVGDQNPHLIRVSFDPPKWHFKWFSHFCRAYDRETIIGSIRGARINCTLDPRYNVLQYNADSVITQLRSWIPIFRDLPKLDKFKQVVHVHVCSSKAS